MAILSLPVRNDLFRYDFKTELDGITYTIDIHYNARKDRWILGIKTSEGTPIIMGIPVLINYNLLGRFADSRLPRGVLFAVNIESEYEEAGKEDLGDNVLLLYSEAS